MAAGRFNRAGRRGRWLGRRVVGACRTARQPVQLLAKRAVAIDGAAKDLDSLLAGTGVTNLLANFGAEVNAGGGRLHDSRRRFQLHAPKRHQPAADARIGALAFE